QAALAESFLLGNGANLRDMFVDIRGNELAIAAYTALQVDKVVVVPQAPDTRLDLCTLLSKTHVLTTGRFECLRSLFQAPRYFWGPARTALFGLVACALLVGLYLLELLPGFADGLVCSPLFRGHGT